jgi:hypothetical protein
MRILLKGAETPERELSPVKEHDNYANERMLHPAFRTSPFDFPEFDLRSVGQA